MNEIQEIELGIEEAKKYIEKKAAVLRLENNRDFKKLVMKGFFEDEASRLALLSADPRLKPEDRQDIMEKLKAISHFHQYIHGIIMQGSVAENSVREYEEALDDIRAEEEANREAA